MGIIRATMSAIGGSWENLLLVNLPQALVNTLAATLLYLLLRKTGLAGKIQGGFRNVQ